VFTLGAAAELAVEGRTEAMTTTSGAVDRGRIGGCRCLEAAVRVALGAGERPA
jgi:hypothetical protein